jgi:hypothetical protein
MSDPKGPNRLNAATCSLGIVTYLGRFETYFQPLIKRLAFLFPDYEINVFINGHHDIVKQTGYLRRISAFLSDYPQVRYLTNVDHQPLARGWNWLILMSTRPWVLILNDDVYCDLEFRYHLEKLANIPSVFTFNFSWSHFVINKAVIFRVGWFDERFSGVGWEDGDMICRLALHGVPLEHIILPGLRNYVAEQKDAGWAKKSEISHNRYASVNLEIFKKKWWHSHWSPVPAQGSFRIAYGGDEWTVASKDALGPMPQFYPFSCLTAPGNLTKRPLSLAAYPAQVLSRASAILWQARRKVAPLIKTLVNNLTNQGKTV